MKVKLEFTLDLDNPSEAENYRRITRVDDIVAALYSIHSEFLERVISDDKLEMTSVQSVLDTINSYLEKYGINLEDIYS